MAVSFTTPVWGQDVQFSQYYAAQTYLNPGFAGAVHVPRLIFHQRLQWPRLDSKYITSLLSFDGFSEKYRSGYGVMLFYDNLGANNISTSEIHFQYSYELPLSQKVTIRPGLQLGFVSRSINYSNLTFPQQFDDFYGLISDNNSYDLYGKDRKFYPDVSAGFIAYSDNFWFSFASNHLNFPNQSFLGKVSRLPVKYSFAAGYKINLREQSKMAYLASSSSDEMSITPTINYKAQGKSDQADIGLYFRYSQIFLGGWYRGIPFKKYNKHLQNNESIVGLAGWIYQNLSFSYSYDLTLSTLRPAGTRGAHEINVTYIFKPKKKRKPMKRLPCPNFYNK